MKVRCPKCGMLLKFHDSDLGKHGKCPRCHQEIVAEWDDVIRSSSTPPPPVVQPSRRRTMAIVWGGVAVFGLCAAAFVAGNLAAKPAASPSVVTPAVPAAAAPPAVPDKAKSVIAAVPVVRTPAIRGDDSRLTAPDRQLLLDLLGDGDPSPTVALRLQAADSPRQGDEAFERAVSLEQAGDFEGAAAACRCTVSRRRHAGTLQSFGFCGKAENCCRLAFNSPNGDVACPSEWAGPQPKCWLVTTRFANCTSENTSMKV